MVSFCLVSSLLGRCGAQSAFDGDFPPGKMFDVYAHLRTKCEILTRNSAEILENASLLPFNSMLIGEEVVAITVFLKTTTISAQSSLH